MTDAYLARMLGVACEMANAQGATLFVVDRDVLRPFLVYNLPSEYIQGIGDVKRAHHLTAPRPGDEWRQIDGNYVMADNHGVVARVVIGR